eukprot:gene1875-33292_t
MHGKWIVSKPGNDDDVIFTFEPHLLAITPKVDIYLKDGDREVDFYAKGNFREKHFQFYDKRGGGDGVKIGECKKQSMFKSLEAFAGRDVYFLDGQLTACFLLVRRDVYFLDVEPGVDYAFLVTICVLMDEKFHDKE